MESEKKTNFIRKWLINKYVITCLVFAVVFVFVGDQSFIQIVKRAKKIQQSEQELSNLEQEINRSQRMLQILENTDSLERYAREKFAMHADNEDVYIVK